MTKKNHHKYFVNQRHKERLESKVYAQRVYYPNIEFITKEPDSKYEREHPYRFWYYEKDIPVDTPVRGKNIYIYYKHPEVSYSIVKRPVDSRYSKKRRYFCKQANKQLRQQMNKSEQLCQYGEYKKLYEVWWKLD